jgi:hypothetical protein
MHQRRKPQGPVLCRIHTRKHEIVISAAGKTHALNLGGVTVTLPVRLLKLDSRLVEHTAELPESFDPHGGGDNKTWQTALGLELYWLEKDQLAELEDFLRRLNDPSETPFFSTLNN